MPLFVCRQHGGNVKLSLTIRLITLYFGILATLALLALFVALLLR